MHGRLKVKTTAEQDAEKKKERQKKLLLFNAGVEKAILKRNQNEYDDEALGVTTQLLYASPDFYTMWNLRKEIIINLKTKKTVEEFNKIISNDVDFTEQCLRVNPKSYGSWYHRFWILREMPQPNWEKELQLCNRYLELDERNFHCWDYRFLIAKYCQVTAEDELRFSDLKISSNFSNYSSWHYRSKLLPAIFPDSDKLRSIDEAKLMQEFELVQNAAFTDPEDQSVWFYHQWLLGQGKQQCCLKFVYSDRVHLILGFTSTISLEEFNKSVSILVNEKTRTFDWKSPVNFDNASAVWFTKLEHCSGFLEVCVKFESAKDNDNVVQLSLIINEEENEKIASFTIDYNLFNKIPLTSDTLSVLHHELESVNQLLDLEPNSKWPLLISTLLMKCLDYDKYKEKIFETIEKLKQVDPLRLGYYQDLRSKYILECVCANSNDSTNCLEMANLKLTKLYHLEYFFHIKKINLSNNLLVNLFGVNLLFCLEELNLDFNEIASCNGLEEMRNLRSLSIKNNKICQLESFSPLIKCDKLTNLDIRNNEVCKNFQFEIFIKSILPNLKILNGNNF